MKISGFTVVRNAEVYDYPLVESIKSILDIVDEFVIAVGESEDRTEDIVRSIESPKIKIINTVWDTDKYRNGGSILAQQTELALRACTGDWCFYIQADEVLHEEALPVVKAACEKYLDNSEVEGFVFRYVHMYADYKRFIDSYHFAYPYEIRIVRNRPDIHSWRDAQSFKVNPGFDGDFLTKEGTRKLKCVVLDAKMFHYGWCRDPWGMAGKINRMHTWYHEDYEHNGVEFHDYGNLSNFPLYKSKQPAVMKDRIENMSWGKLLHYDGPNPDIKKVFGTKYRILRFVENKILGGRMIGGFHNYVKLSRFSLKK